MSEKKRDYYYGYFFELKPGERHEELERAVRHQRVSYGFYYDRTYYSEGKRFALAPFGNFRVSKQELDEIIHRENKNGVDKGTIEEASEHATRTEREIIYGYADKTMQIIHVSVRKRPPYIPISELV